MAGKRVRCRGCGDVFTVASPGDSLGSKTAVGATPPSRDVVAPAPVRPPVAAVSASTARPTVATGPSRLIPHSDIPSPTSEARAPIVEEGDDEDEKPDAESLAAALVGDARFNVAMVYPGAEVIDRFLPYFLILLSFGWIAGETIRSNELGPMWVSTVRISIFWIIYAVLVWPLTLIGSGKAGRRARVEVPPAHPWRVFATFAFPTALGYILFSIVGGLGSFVTGTLVGLAIGLALYYILYRLRPEEGPKAIPVVGAYYIGSLVLAVLALMALNFSLQQFMTASRTAHEFASSPMGRYLAWNPPTPEPTDVPRSFPAITPNPYAVKPSAPIEPATAPTTQVTPLDAPSSVAGVSPPVPAVTEPEPLPTDGVFGAPTTQVAPGATEPAVAVAVPAVGQPPVADDAPITATDGLVGRRPPRINMFTTDGTDPAASVIPPVAAAAVNSPLIESIRPSAELGTFDEAVFPTVPSKHVMIVRRVDLNEDDVEVWSLNPAAKVGAAHFRRDPGVNPNYLLSPDGKTITRIAQFPELSIQAWSVTESRVLRSISLNKGFGKPTALGFNDDNTLWLLWTLNGKYGMEGWDLTTGGRVRQLELGNYVPSPNNFAFAADGKEFATLKGPRAAGQQQELSVVNLRTGQLVRRFLINGLDRQLIVEPTAIAFSADSSKVCVALEHHGQGLVIAWPVVSTDGKPFVQHLFPNGFPGDKVPNRAASFAWLPSGNEWLVNGTGLIDVATGRTIGDLSQPRAIAQRVVDGSMVELVTLPNSGEGAGPNHGGTTGQASCSLVTVKLKPIPVTK